MMALFLTKMAEYYRKRIKVTQRQLWFAERCDWAGQIIYCKILLADYENKLMDIIFNTEKYKQ